MALKNSNSDLENYKIIERISRLSGRRLSSLELIAVVYDLKPAMAEMVNFREFNESFIKKLDKINKLCKKLSLHFVVSKYKFIINSPRGIFKMVDLDSPQKGKIAMGISKDKERALRGVDLYYEKIFSSQKGREFGQVMGYPECCLDFGDYLCNDNDDPNNFGFKNPAVESLKRSEDFAWQLNVFSYSLLSYYPCSLTCAPSISSVNKIISFLEIADPKRAEMTVNNLKEPASLYWTCVDKILLYGDFKGDFRNSEIKYNRLVSELDSENFYQSNDLHFLNNLKRVQEKVQQGNKLIMAPDYFEIYKDKRRIAKIKKENQYEPVLIKPNR